MTDTCETLKMILSPAFRPCESFGTACSDYAKWNPKLGYVPRGFVGAIGDPSKVELVIVNAEPGDPSDNEYYDERQDLLLQSLSFSYKALELDLVSRAGRKARFHVNLCQLLDLCFPGLSLELKLERTWITNATLCSAHISGGQIPKKVEKECLERYLKPQLDFFDQAFVLALGNKAKKRLRNAGISIHATGHHPSARNPNAAQASWVKASNQFLAWRRERPVQI